MTTDIDQELAALPRMTTNELCERYQQLFRQPVRTRHKQYLVRKIAWRIQSLAEGDLSERARRRAAGLANDADVRLMPPKPRPAATAAPGAATGATRVVKAPTGPPAADARLPAPGAALVRQYKGRQVRVVVLPDGFEYEGQKYKTLTAVAKHVTGCHMNGFRFFRLEARP
jgi:hypothetical protein